MAFLNTLFTGKRAQFSRETIQDLREYHSAAEAVARIREIYDASTSRMRQAFRHGLEGSSSSDENASLQDTSTTSLSATYPYLGIDIPPQKLNIDGCVAYGAATEPGEYGITLTRPDLFEAYYLEQIDLLMRHHGVPVYVGSSPSAIPLPFVMASVQGPVNPQEHLGIESVLPNLSVIDDHIANGIYDAPEEGSPMPLALFTAERVDFSLSRLHHYTGTSVEHFQRFILLTNYQRYVHAFIAAGQQMLREDQGYEALVEPGDYITSATSPDISPEISGERVVHLPQMPAYHLKRPDGDGITFINIGVGPSNAKNITDHLAVLRPHCWLMLGHCAGLRRSQTLGDYVLAHGYVREDHVLDDDLPSWVPVPPIAEVQVALQDALCTILQSQGDHLKSCLRTGTVVTTANRNWELRIHEMSERYRQSRAIAVDMESATVAANGFRFRVPYGTLLCVSDKPLHGELKLRSMADHFYRQRVDQHLQIGLETMKVLRQKGVDQLHSRKLRGFNEPPFR